MTLRIGDRERDEAIERLSQHAAAGRLDVHELERRIERVHAAVFESDLDAVEADLPSPVVRRREHSLPGFPLLAVALLVLAIAASVAIGHPAPPLFFLAIFVFRRLQHRAV